jgi:hypothetical protein
MPSRKQRPAAGSTPSDSPAAAVQLAGFIAKYDPEIAALAERVLARMRARLPGAVELVYDNYNALAIGFGPSERASQAIFSVVLYPRWVSLFFLQARGLNDPQKLLRGHGSTARHIVLKDADTLDEPAVQKLMKDALEKAATPLNATAPGGLVIKSISAAQRPRRPSKAATANPA